MSSPGKHNPRNTKDMPRLILTFPTMFDVLAADKLLRTKFNCRPTPTPPGLSTSICGMSLELLNPEERDQT
ncbi:MAG: DUF3343 domain-containing protein, partial [Candidatus Obscuribacterales bacterium]|nr:DUF3343 domain-containing protein [Candidatus Obscuribacterales bacterium]